jgi:hypothetical protein
MLICWVVRALCPGTGHGRKAEPRGCESPGTPSRPERMWISWTTASSGASMVRKPSKTAPIPGTKINPCIYLQADEFENNSRSRRSYWSSHCCWWDHELLFSSSRFWIDQFVWCSLWCITHAQKLLSMHNAQLSCEEESGALMWRFRLSHHHLRRHAHSSDAGLP